MPPWTPQTLALVLPGDKNVLFFSSPLSVAAPEGAVQAVASFIPPIASNGGVVGLVVDIFGGL